MTKDVQAQIDRLLPILYAAPGSEQRWSQFIENFARSAGAVQGLFLHHNTRSKNTVLSCGFNLGPEWAQVYADYYQYLNPYLALPPSSSGKNGSVALLSELIDDAEVEKTEFFHDYVVPQRVTVRNAIRLIPNKADGCVTAIALHRSLSDYSADTESALKLSEELIPHLRLALDLHGRLSSLQSRMALLERTLDRLPFGLVILDSALTIVALNGHAEEIFARGDGLGLRNGRLTSIVPSERDQIHEGIRRAMGLGHGGRGPSGSQVRITRRGGKRPYELLIAPLVEHDSLLDSADRGVVLLLTDLERNVATPTGLLRQRYGLTAAEERVALLLLQGQDIKAIGESLWISSETVRSQLKAIFRKTEARRQSELISRLLQGNMTVAAGLSGIDGESER